MWQCDRRGEKGETYLNRDDDDARREFFFAPDGLLLFNGFLTSSSSSDDQFMVLCEVVCLSACRCHWAARVADESLWISRDAATEDANDRGRERPIIMIHRWRAISPSLLPLPLVV